MKCFWFQFGTEVPATPSYHLMWFSSWMITPLTIWLGSDVGYKQAIYKWDNPARGLIHKGYPSLHTWDDPLSWLSLGMMSNEPPMWTFLHTTSCIQDAALHCFGLWRFYMSMWLSAAVWLSTWMLMVMKCIEDELDSLQCKWLLDFKNAWLWPTFSEVVAPSI